MILFHWPVVGWHIGVLQERNKDGRIKRDHQSCNFKIYYEVDDDVAAQAYLAASEIATRWEA